MRIDHAGQYGLLCAKQSHAVQWFCGAERSACMFELFHLIGVDTSR